MFETFAQKFLAGKPSPKQKEIVDILRNSIGVFDGAAIKNLSIDDSVFVICDTLYSRSTYDPILVSNVPKKVEKATEFYHKKDPEANIPYPIYTVEQTELILRGRFPELCVLVDDRIRLGNVGIAQTKIYRGNQ